jgi:hypothetical protein
MINMLGNYGLNFVRVEGVDDPTILHDKVAEAHIKALETGADLILEDDCLPYEYREEIEFPDDADVVYLGVSTGTTHTHKPKYKKLSNEIYRLYDMTSTHAILYITEAGRQWLRNAYFTAAKDLVGFDMATAKLMPTIKAYGLNVPIWYQRDADSQTKITLDQGLLSDAYFGGGYKDYPKPLV